jgi:hypothetical protein
LGLAITSVMTMRLAATSTRKSPVPTPENRQGRPGCQPLRVSWFACPCPTRLAAPAVKPERTCSRARLSLCRCTRRRAHRRVQGLGCAKNCKYAHDFKGAMVEHDIVRLRANVESIIAPPTAASKPTLRSAPGPSGTGCFMSDRCPSQWRHGSQGSRSARDCKIHS